VGAAFAASLVECVEALTIVLAVSSVSGWRSGLLGASSGVVLLVALVGLAGGALVRVPLNELHIFIGLILLAFGFSWLRKAVLRAAGIKPQRDEAAIYRRKIDEMRSNRVAGSGNRLDLLATTAAFKAVVIEGVEVVLIVVAVGRVAGTLVPAAMGAIAAVIVVVALAIAIHRPLTRVPENALKFGVGVVIVSFGIFWFGEGLGFAWVGGDLAVIAIIACVFAFAHLCVAGLHFQIHRIGVASAPRPEVAGSSNKFYNKL